MRVIALTVLMFLTFLVSNAQTVLTSPKLEVEVEQRFSNPIMPGADPHAIAIENTIWVYPTWSERGRRQFFAFSSTNLLDWQRHGPILDFQDVTWINDDGAPVHYAWAPSAFPDNGKVYFYYAVGPQNPTPSRIGVAVANSPSGPFIDIGKPLLTGGKGFEAIDPMVFRDPKSGSVYLYAGGSAGAKLRVFELGTNLVTIAREIAVTTPRQFTEGPFMHHHDGRYYLSYSHGSYRHSSYSVHYSSSDSPVGPWTYHGKILSSDETRKGPGHHSFVKNPASDEWLIFYHRWENVVGDGPYQGLRQMCVDRVERNAEGMILPIKMTSKEMANPPTTVQEKREAATLK
ncbi:MAG: family 43 glycosylhydrolase [Verrucomicrobiales bacterium]